MSSPGTVIEHRGVSVMALGTLLSRISGLARNVVLAQLGLSALTDAYTLANTSPNLFYELVVGGVLSATLVPLFVGLVTHSDSPHETRRNETALSAIITLASIVVLAMSVALWFFAPWMLRALPAPESGWEPGQFDFAVMLLRMFAPQVACYGGVTLTTALLHSQRKFTWPAIAPVLNNVFVTAIFWWVKERLEQHRVDDRIDFVSVNADTSVMRALGWGTTVGVLVMFAAAVPAVMSQGIRLRPVWRPRHPVIRELIRVSGWTMGYVAANQVAVFFVLGAAKRGEQGDVTAYVLANSVFFQLPHGIIAVSLISALQPTLSRAFLDRKRGAFRMSLAAAMRSLVVLLVPAAIGYILLAPSIAEIVLAHGNTTVRDAERVADVLRGLAIGLPSFSIYLLLMSAFKAMRDMRATFEINVIENALNIVFGAVLYTQLGVAGLGMAYAAAYIVSAVIAAVLMTQRTAGLQARAFFQTINRVIAAAAFMSAGVVFIGWLASAVFDRSEAALDVPTDRFFSLSCTVVVQLVVGVGLYLAACSALRVQEAAMLTRIPRQILRRVRR
jgi:putative peptidoglycan lipid II flippase